MPPTGPHLKWVVGAQVWQGLSLAALQISVYMCLCVRTHQLVTYCVVCGPEAMVMTCRPVQTSLCHEVKCRPATVKALKPHREGQWQFATGLWYLLLQGAAQPCPPGCPCRPAQAPDGGADRPAPEA